MPDAFERRSNGKSEEHEEDAKLEDDGRGRSGERKENGSISKDATPVNDRNGDVGLPPLQKEVSPAELPPPVMQS